MAMYFIIINEKDSSNPVNQLVDDLIDAEKRGVDVKVALEDSKLKANRLSYKELRNNGVDVYFDTPEHLLHIKGVAIDDRYLFIGSTNWSRAAIENNYEASFFVDSPEDAIAFKKYVNNIPVQKKNILLPITEGVRLSSNFLLSSELGPELLKAQAYKQFELYLLLCKIAQEKRQVYFDPPSPATGDDEASARSSLRQSEKRKPKDVKPWSFDIDYDSLAKKMGYKVPDDLGKYRNAHHYFYERIHRLLKPLKKHGLIDYKKGKVTLKANVSSDSSKPEIIIPFEYWEYDYSDKLSMRAKYMYLICLYEAARSTRYPFWFRSQKDMSELYGISDTTISLGVQELEDKGLVEITRDHPTPPDFADRKANVYKMLSLEK